jgi:hypothetical protein
MAKRLSKEEKNLQIIKDLINEMFKIAGHSVVYEDIAERKDNWFNDWTMTHEQYDEWIKWGKAYIKKNLKTRAFVADREMAMIGLMWGLKFADSKDLSNE